MGIEASRNGFELFVVATDAKANFGSLTLRLLVGKIDLIF
jgi:hypothetical protein